MRNLLARTLCGAWAFDLLTIRKENLLARMYAVEFQESVYFMISIVIRAEYDVISEGGGPYDDPVSNVSGFCLNFI
jgi:hypothetical protein